MNVLRETRLDMSLDYKKTIVINVWNNRKQKRLYCTNDTHQQTTRDLKHVSEPISKLYDIR